jgi:hypothetical protein
MTYTLETNHINPRENLFFHQAGLVTFEQRQEYIVPIIEKHIAKGSWSIPKYSWYDRTIKTFQRPTGEWQMVSTTQNFVSIQAAAEFFQDLIADGTEFRRILRTWHQAHGILNETNILDELGEIVEVIHACQAHKCIRFGSCPVEGTGCNVVGQTVFGKTYPIYHTK